MASSSTQPIMEVDLEDDEAVSELDEPGEEISTSATVKKRSPIWKYFEEMTEGTKAKCTTCKTVISRSGKGKAATNTTMHNHLKLKHPDLYKSFASTRTQTSKSNSGNSQQPTLESVIGKLKKWEIKDPRAVAINYAIAEMICTDLQPMSVIENSGFIRLLSKAQPRYQIPSRTHIRETILTDIYQRCLKEMKEAIKIPDYISCTTDIWTAGNNNEPFISLTAHWVTINFEYKYLYLNASSFQGSHTGPAIATKVKDMLATWEIQLAKVHLILRDNAANMEKGMKDAALPSAPCFIHTLQLVITDCITNQRTVRDAVAICRHIVSHFRHSALGTNRLRQIQRELNLPNHKRIQDVSTRWNSTYYMLARILEQRRAISYYCGENSGLNNLSQIQWNLIESIVTLLQPFEEVTKIISESESIISEVIPYVATLISYLDKPSDDHHGVRPLKDLLKTSTQSRFGNLQDSTGYTAATFLDPRFKLGFIEESRRDNLKQILLEEMGRATQMNLEAAHKSSNPRSLPVAFADVEEPSPSILKTAKTHGDFWTCFTEVSDNCVFANTNRSEIPSYQTRAILEVEISAYSYAEKIDRHENPFSWWKENSNMYPNLSKLAKKYLSAPASSVFSERLFSTEGIVYESHRNRTLPENAEMITLLNRNLKLLEFKY